MVKKKTKATATKPAKKTIAKIKAAQTRKAKKPKGKQVNSQQEKKLARLQNLLETEGSKTKVQKLLLSLDEKARRGLAPMCFKWLRTQKRNAATSTTNPLLYSAEVAAFCVGNLTELKKVGRWWWPQGETIVEILKCRKPNWTPQLVDMLLHSTSYWHNWRTVRNLVRAKLCPKPDDVRYYTGMISGIRSSRSRNSTDKTLYKILLEDSALLQDEVWRLFEHEGEDLNTLANVDRFDGTNWSGVLIKLCEEGKLSRPRLLASTLAALELGFNHYRAKWFMDFFDRLNPNDKELKKNAETILELVSSPTPNVAQWAYVRLQSIYEKGIIKDREKLISAVRPLLLAKQKGKVIAALKTLVKFATTKTGVDERLIELACTFATDALAHEKADVQKAALKIICTHIHPNNETVRISVERQLPLVSASNRKAINEWLNLSNTTSTEGSPTENPTPKSKRKRSSAANRKAKPFEQKRFAKFSKHHIELLKLNDLVKELDSTVSHGNIPAVEFAGTEFPRLDPSKQVVPIADLDELLEVCGRVIEDEMALGEGERALEGLARLGADKPEDFGRMVGPLYKRANQLASRSKAPFIGQGLVGDLCGIICVWVNESKASTRKIQNQHGTPRLEITGVFEEPFNTWYTEHLPLSFLSLRSLQIAQRINAESFQILSAPTHCGGWIDPFEFVNRVNKQTEPPLESDLTLSLLRLAPENRKEALKTLKPKLKGEWANVVKYALGGSVTIGKTAPLWIAAARCRFPVTDDTKISKAFSKLHPGAGKVSEFKVDLNAARSGSVTSAKQVPETLDVRIPTQLIQHNNHFHDIGNGSGSILWLAMMYPLALDSFFASGAIALFDNRDWWEAAWHNRYFLEPLLDSDVPLKNTASFALMCGLAAKEPGEHGLSVDIMIQAITDGRLGTDNLASLMSQYLPPDPFNLARLVKCFADIVAASPLHALVIFRSLENSICSLPLKRRGLGALFGFMLELGTEHGLGIVQPEVRNALEAIKGSSKAAKNAKQLLQIENEFNPKECIELSIEARIERLETWKARG